MAQTSRSADLTSGPMLQKIILFSIPLAASSILQLLFNAADVVVVGRLPVMADMMTKPSATGTRLSRPSRQSNTSKRTNRPMGVAIALYLSGS